MQGSKTATSRRFSSRMRTTPAFRRCSSPAGSGVDRPDEADARDLGRNPEAHRRSPVAGAAVHVNPHPAEALETGRERLLQAHEVIPRPELAAVRVTRKLEGVARPGRVES